MDKLHHALQLAAGALEAVVAGGAVQEVTVITFTEAFAHLGQKSVGDILDECDRALGTAPAELPTTAVMPALDRAAARSQGYTGDQCDRCNSMRVRNNGTCKVCDDCGTTTGCS